MGVNTRRWVVLLAALAMTALTARLGLWQLDRAAQKQAIQAAIDARAGEPAVTAEALARTPQAAEAQWHRQTVLEGRWRPEHAVFLDNRPLDGRAGFVLLMPLELAGGDAVLVQRGWAPRDLQDRRRLPDVPTPAGTVRVSGRIAPPPAALYALGDGDSGRLRQNIDLAAHARDTGLALRPLSVLQADAGAPQDGLLRRWPAPAVDVHKHYGYAFQWFALAILTSALYVWFQLLEPRRRRQRARG